MVDRTEFAVCSAAIVIVLAGFMAAAAIASNSFQLAALVGLGLAASLGLLALALWVASKRAA